MGKEVAKAAPASGRETLTAAEQLKEMKAKAEAMIENAEAAIKKASSLEDLSNKAKDAIATVNKKIKALKRELRTGLTKATLDAANEAFKESIDGKDGLLDAVKGGHDDPLDPFLGNLYRKVDTNIVAPKTLAAAQAALLNRVRATRFRVDSPHTGVNFSIDSAYNRAADDLAAARQLQRLRGKLPSSGDKTLDFTQELFDTMRLSQQAEKGDYSQESADNVQKREARLFGQLARIPEVKNLGPGEAADLGFVVVQQHPNKNLKGVYLVTMAVPAEHGGKPMTFPDNLVVDTSFEARKAAKKREIDQMKRKPGGQFSEAILKRLEKEYDEMQPIKITDAPFPNEEKYHVNASEASWAMQDKLEGKDWKKEKTARQASREVDKIKDFKKLLSYVQGLDRKGLLKMEKSHDSFKVKAVSKIDYSADLCAAVEKRRTDLWIPESI